MNSRTEMRDAASAIDRVFHSIDAGRVEFDRWVSDKLAWAIGSHWRGAYRVALVAADDALAPVSERASYLGVPDYSLGSLREAFVVATTEPYRVLPQIGPVVVVPSTT